MKLPRDLSGTETLNALRRLGFNRIRQSGSHVIVRKGDRTVVVPKHKTLKPGTLSGILAQAGVTLKDFTNEL